ncbi:MAG: plastocyanin/azurin family copper-binding protein [Candidatus Kariarchaeaceae archaeon]|jgi:azurin
MKKTYAFVFIGLFLGLSMAFTASNVVAQPTPGAQCSEPTHEVTIRALLGTRFNTDKIEVPRNTCVKITIVNEDPDIPHDISIDPVSGVDGIVGVYVPVNGGETASFNVTTPDIDVTFDFYCSVVGHRAKGMEGDFVVGAGSSEDDSPGFGLWIAFTAFLASATLIKRKRK